MVLAIFPPVRACLFDMDGLLLDTEDIATECHTRVLANHKKPPLPPSIKAKMMGRNGTAAVQILQNWAKLRISNDQYRSEVALYQQKLFSTARPLPGVEKLLADLESTNYWEKQVRNEGEPQKVHIALATSSSSGSFKVKTSHLEGLFDVFVPHRRVLGDDPRISSGRGKPLPDIYELALRTINDSLAPGEKPVLPEECLVFEDSVTGVEAGRRAGMRVVWCPQAVLQKEYAGMEDKVLAGRTGAAGDVDMDRVGELNDGWAEQLADLVDFPYEKYGIVLPPVEDDGGGCMVWVGRGDSGIQFSFQRPKVTHKDGQARSGDTMR